MYNPEEPKIRRATLDDVEYIAATFIEAEKNSTDKIGPVNYIEATEEDITKHKGDCKCPSSTPADCKSAGTENSAYLCAQKQLIDETKQLMQWITKELSAATKPSNSSDATSAS